MKKENHFSFLVVGKTQESTETQEGFKRYIGLASSYVLAVNPKKKELDELMGYESANEPEYIRETDNGKEALVTFIVRTDPEVNNGIEITNKLTFTLRNARAYNKDQTKVQVTDDFGNSSWIPVDDANAGKAILQADGNPKKIDTKYRIAAVGECDLINFLRTYLGVPDGFGYVNGIWVKKENADEGKFCLEHFKDYLNGDFSELREALALRPNNKVKLLYGVRTNEGKQYQAIASREGLVLRNNAGSKQIAQLEKDLANAKQNGAYATTEFKVQELQEYTVQPTNLEQPANSNDNGAGAMPWD